MDQAKTIEAKAWDIFVMNEVLSPNPVRIILKPIPSNGKNLARTQLNRNNIGETNSSLLPLKRVLKSLKVYINMHLKEGIPIVKLIRRAFARQFVILLLNIVRIRTRIGKLNVTVEARELHLSDFVRCVLHDLSHSLCH